MPLIDRIRNLDIKSGDKFKTTFYLKDKAVISKAGKTQFITDQCTTSYAESEDYYEEWFDDIEDGWIVGLNFRDHVIREFNDFGIDQYILFSGRFDEINWRKYQPVALFELIQSFMQKRLNP
jgi:hypothetical protein